MKMDTTTWILLAVLGIMLWEMEKKKTAAAAGSLSGGYYPGAAGAAGAAGKAGTSSLLQQLLGGTGNTTKPSAGISAGGSAGSSPAAAAQNNPLLPNWFKVLINPQGNQVALAQNPPLTSLLASTPPPVYQSPEMDFPGVTPIATIPSDTSNIFITPDEPPTWTNPTMNTSVTSTFVDDSGNPIDIPTNLTNTTDQTPDPTAFSPVDTQTIDTSTLGTIDYLPTTQWYDPVGDTLSSSPFEGGMSLGGGTSSLDNYSAGGDFQSDNSDD